METSRLPNTAQNIDKQDAVGVHLSLCRAGFSAKGNDFLVAVTLVHDCCYLQRAELGPAVMSFANAFGELYFNVKE